MKIKVSNFLAYSKPVEFDLRKTNLFIGGNNCGKSTFSKLIVLLQNLEKGYAGYDFSSSLYNFQGLFQEILTFNDLLFDSKKPISVTSEFYVTHCKVILELNLFQNEGYQIDDFGINKGGCGVVSSIAIDGSTLYERLDNKACFFRAGFLKARELFNELAQQNEPDYDWSGVANLKLVLNLLAPDWEKQFDSDGLYLMNISEDTESYLERLWIKEILQGVKDLFSNQLAIFSLISPQTYENSLHHYESKGIIDSIKSHFGAEIVYRDIFRGTGSNNNELKVIRKEIFVSYKNKEVPIEAMGLGFRNLYQILFTNASKSWTSYVGQRSHFPIYQEPEIGLHPDWQVKLFKLIKSGIIETHSLIILRALQLEVADGNFSSDDVMVHNFYRDKNDEIEVKQIKILSSGILSDEFESGFQDELIQIEHKLWEIQQKLINRN